MLAIRAEQFAVLEQSARDRFERRLAADLHASFPEECAGRDEPGLLSMVREAIARAGQYGLESERDLGLFTDLWLVLGPDFDLDLPWAAQLLNDPYILDPALRIDRLHERAMAALADAEAG
jgi:hypothetical protein